MKFFPPRLIRRSVILAALLPAPAITASTARADATAITGQPVGQTVRLGQRAGFAVVAPGATAYQWYVSRPNGQGGLSAPMAVPNATGPFLLTGPVAAGDAGASYTVAVAGAGDTTLSAPATVTLAGSADGAPPDSFWGQPASLPAATQALTLEVLNRTNGHAADAQIFWSVRGQTDTGQQVNEMHALSERPIYDMPAISSARMYVYIAADASQVGTGPKNYFDFIEFNIGRSNTSLPYNFNGDTTRVDAFGLKLAFRLQCAGAKPLVRGEDYGTFLEPRTVTFEKYRAEVPPPFAAASRTAAPYRILEPGASGFGVGGPYQDYMKGYVDAVWANNGIDTNAVAKATPFINLQQQLPDLSAALHRHVAGRPGTFKADGTLVDPDFWRKVDPKAFYRAAPASFYAAYWHEHAIGGYQYAFPYDDVGGYSSDVSCNGPQSLIVAVGW